MHGRSTEAEIRSIL
ncbi:hypothetical protein [Sinorhizobium fredii]